MSEKRIGILLADGFEEIEAITPIDLLRRGNVIVEVIGVTGNVVTGSHDIPVGTDMLIEDMEADDFDGIIVPGGMPGAVNLSQSPRAAQVIRDMWSQGKLVAAICAAPAVVLAPLGILDGKKATCYPGIESRAPEIPFLKEPVVADGNLITAQGPGKAAGFSLAVLEALTDAETARQVKEKSLF